MFPVAKADALGRHKVLVEGSVDDPCSSQLLHVSCNVRPPSVIELDDGKIYRKALYLMVKTHGFPVDFPLNQSIDSDVSWFR